MNSIVLQAVSMIGWAAFGCSDFWRNGIVRSAHPIDYRAEIRKGNIAAGFVVAAVIVSISGVVVTLLVT